MARLSRARGDSWFVADSRLAGLVGKPISTAPDPSRQLKSLLTHADARRYAFITCLSPRRAFRHHCVRRTPAPHFLRSSMGVLHHMELVANDGAVRHSLLNAGLVRRSHFHARSSCH